MTSQEVSRWADAAMFRSEPQKAGPKVTLLNATPDPLGSLAALCAMYTGRVVRDLNDLTNAERMEAFADVRRTELQGPLEVVQFHFLVEGVTRAFTHQMVRERQAFFAQESMRFAVPEEEWATSGRIALPPSLAGTNGHEAADVEGSDAEYRRNIWDTAIHNVDQAYKQLIDLGMPAEDARGLMPQAITTRLHWVVDLRGLLYVAGLRLCTQAQFEWRQVMAQVVLALRAYARRDNALLPSLNPVVNADGWQFKLMADALRPICYAKGACGFKSRMDRPCTIRDRVDANEKVGRPSAEWGQDLVGLLPDDMGVAQVEIGAIHPAEWAADAGAAR